MEGTNPEESFQKVGICTDSNDTFEALPLKPCIMP